MEKEQDLLTEKGKAAIGALLAMGYTKEKIGEMLEILAMAQMTRRESDAE